MMCLARSTFVPSDYILHSTILFSDVSFLGNSKNRNSAGSLLPPASNFYKSLLRGFYVHNI